MKMTLLELVQDILNDMDSDEVNSITDTQEAVQVAQIVKTTYLEMMTRRGGDWAHLRKLANLESIADNARPNYLKLPENLSRIDFINYDVALDTETRIKYRRIDYISPSEFLETSNSLNTDNANVTSVTDFGGIVYAIQNDRAPTKYTSFDDEYVVFNSYDSVKETTMQGIHSQAQIYLLPTWSAVDAAIPDLPPLAFPALLAEAKSVAMAKLKQMPDLKAEQQSIRGQRMLANDNFRLGGGVTYPDYGRKRGGSTRRNPLFDKGR